MFDFQNHLNFNPNGSKKDKWAIVVSCYDRLKLHGVEVQLYQNKDRNAASPLAVSFGSKAFDHTGDLSGVELDGDDWIEITRDKVLNRASWVGIEPDDLKKSILKFGENVNDALRSSIDNWARVFQNTNDLHSLEAKLLALESMGFDIYKPFFHETSVKNKESLLSNGFDLSKVAGRVSEKHFPDGVYLKSSTESIGLAEDAVQLPYFLKKSQFFNVEDRGDMERITNKNVIIKNLRNSFEEENKRFDDVVGELTERLCKTPGDESLKIEIKSQLAKWKLFIDNSLSSLREAITEHLKSQGVRVVSVNNDSGSLNRKVGSFISLYPKDLSSGIISLIPSPSLEQINKKLKIMDNDNTLSIKETSSLLPPKEKMESPRFPPAGFKV